jgi:hypothetical protein
MDSSTTHADYLVNMLDYLDTNLLYLSDIYKCPCQTCITSQTIKINSLISYIISFFKFIIKNKEFIKKNDTYLYKLLNLLPIMIKFNNEIIKDNIDYFNLQRSISIMYLEKEENTDIYEKPFLLETFIKYYPNINL